MRVETRCHLILQWVHWEVHETSDRLKGSVIVPVVLLKVLLSIQPRLVRATARLQRTVKPNLLVRVNSEVQVIFSFGAEEN